MDIKIIRVDGQNWKGLSEYAHQICFDEKKPWEFDRIDYALLAVYKDVPSGYLTVREVDSETVYWQYGGAFPSIRNTYLSYKTYEAFVEFQGLSTQRITTLIENTNLVMMKFAMKVGFKIVGVKNFKGTILLEHVLEY